MYTDLESLCVAPTSSIRDAVQKIDASRLGIALVTDGEQRLVGTVTDGDLRRAMLAGTDLNRPVSELLARKAGSQYSRPITAPVGTSRERLLELLQEYRIIHLPLIDEQHRVVGLVTQDDFLPEQDSTMQAVIMAGGLGARLRPLSDDIPKPMLPVGDRPLLEIIIGQLREAGITQVSVTTHYKPQKIADHFGNGNGFGVELSYVEEDSPLGTAGAIGLMKAPKQTLLVMNGDILTQVDFRAMLAFHREHRAEFTVAVREYDFQVPYGVVECEEMWVRRLTEKPQYKFFVNAGIYLLEPEVCRYIPRGFRMDMTDLIQRLLDEGRRIASFPIREYWLDIGQHSDYARAQEHAKHFKQRS